MKDGLDRPLVAALCAMAFVVLAGYECARSPATAILGGADAEVTDTTAKQRTEERMPTALLLVVLGVVATVGVYNRYSPRVPLPTLMGAVLAVSAGTLVLVLALLAMGLPGARYAVFVWKDVYIVLVLEAFWTFANSVFALSGARRVYGLMLLCGSLGSVAGARVSRLAGAPEVALRLVLPSLLLAWLVSWWIARRTGASALHKDAKKARGIAETLEVLRESRYVALLALLVFSTQMVIVTTEFQFNVAAAAAFPDDAARNAAISSLWEYVGWSSAAMQVLAGGVVALLGVGGALLLVPALGAIAITTAALIPGYALMAGAFGLTKVLDYSVFKAAKEMLYLPLSHREKTQGKAAVDMMSYRVAKGGAALLLMGLGAAGALNLVPWITLAWVGVWVTAALMLARRYLAKTSEA